MLGGPFIAHLRIARITSTKQVSVVLPIGPSFETEDPMLINLRWTLPAALLAALAGPACADTITDWNEKTVAFVTTQAMLPPEAERVVAMVHVAMFDAVNSVERRYRPYLAALPAAGGTSKEAAAAAAAAAVLAGLNPGAAEELRAGLAAYLATLPQDPGQADGIKLG